LNVVFEWGFKFKVMSNQTKITELAHTNSQIKSVYGGQKVILYYTLETICNNIKNKYELEAELRGIQSNDLHLNLLDVKALNNNEETLAFEGIENLLNW